MAEAPEQVQAPTEAETLDASEFSELLKRPFVIKDEEKERQKNVEGAVRHLAKEALKHADLRSKDVVRTIQGIKAKIDEALTSQVNEILHHPDFQQVESAWRGLHHLVNNTETDQMLKIKFMSISKEDLRKSLSKYRGTAWDQSPLFKTIYEYSYGLLGGVPYGCLVGDYYFDHSAPDVNMLGDIAKVAAAAHTPFIAGAAPKLLSMESWQELPKYRDLAKVFSTDDYIAWRSLRGDDDARYIGLTLPRFLARLPYDPIENPVEEFNFTEKVEGTDHHKYAWANAAYPMAVNINKAFKLFRWCVRIRGYEAGGIVEKLPVHTFPSDDGGLEMKCPTEIAIPDRREKELADSGFMPLIHRSGTNEAAFIGAQSLQEPQKYDDPDATANARLSARLPYLFAASRFAHYLKWIVRDKVGTFKERADMQDYLSNWIDKYVLKNPAVAREEDKARQPLAKAELVVEDVEGDPGYYNARIFLRPHYQLEGLTASLRLVSKLPSEKG